jgi:hypothetical protein
MTAAFGAVKGNIVQKYQNLASQDVIQAVQSAARKTGADFAFLMQKASAESSFNPTAKAKTSSATGLYQFIESTWLNMVKKHGDKFGLGDYADKIEMKNGKAVCPSDCDRKDILALRNDPEIAALMAGAFTSENKAHLQKNTKGGVGATELYFAHFMGAGGAAKFLNSRSADGEAIAAELFPVAAGANKNVFYDRATGKPRTLNEVYAFFDRKFGDKAAPSGAGNRVAEIPSGSQAAKTIGLSQQLAAFAGQEIRATDNSTGTSLYPQSGFTARSNPFGFQKVSPVSILMLAEIQQGLISAERKSPYGAKA